MSWLISILAALLAGAAAAAAGGYVANLAVGWYGVSSFEGQSGYLVVGNALIGLVVGSAIGLVVARLVLTRPEPSVALAWLLAPGAALLVVALVGGTARLLADVPPHIDGEALLLQVEPRLPAGAPLPEPTDGEWAIALSSAAGRTVRRTVHGPLWRDDARLEDGRWVVPGAVELFTSRGGRLLGVEPGGMVEHGFLVPVPAYPGRELLQWSEWLPRARPAAPRRRPGSRAGRRRASTTRRGTMSYRTVFDVSAQSTEYAYVVALGYGEHAGMQRALRDAMRVRIRYRAQRVLGQAPENAILKLEIEEAAAPPSQTGRYTLALERGR